jgi:hypothetical protein
MLTCCLVLQGEIETCMKMLGAKDLSELGPRFVSVPSVPEGLLLELPGTDTTDSRSIPAWWSGISSTAMPAWTGQGSGRQPAPSSEHMEPCLPSMRGATILLCFKIAEVDGL